MTDENLEGGFSTGIRIFLVLVFSITSVNFKSPLHFFLPRNSSHVGCVTAALFKTRPCFCDRGVLQVISQFALLSYSTSGRFTILLAQNCRSHLCFVTTALLNSSLCLSVDERSVSILVASLFCCYSIVEFSCLLRGRSIPGTFSLFVSPQHIWCHLYLFFILTQHYSSHPSISLVTEDFFLSRLSCRKPLGSLVTFFLYCDLLTIVPAFSHGYFGQNYGSSHSHCV